MSHKTSDSSEPDEASEPQSTSNEEAIEPASQNGLNKPEQISSCSGLSYDEVESHSHNTRMNHLFLSIIMHIFLTMMKAFNPVATVLSALYANQVLHCSSFYNSLLTNRAVHCETKTLTSHQFQSSAGTLAQFSYPSGGWVIPSK